MHPTAMAKHEMGQASISERGSGRDVVAGRYRLDEMLLIEVLHQVKRRGEYKSAFLLDSCIQSDNLTNALVYRQSSHRFLRT